MVAGRPYPLHINRADEEVFRKAAQRIEEVLTAFQRDYQIEDKTDLLAMVCLRLASEAESAKGRLSDQKHQTEVKLQALLDLMN